MELILAYIVFAITTGICSWLFYFKPILKDAIELKINNSFTRQPVLSSIVYIILSIIAAPLLFFPMFNSVQSLVFKEVLVKEMFKETPGSG